MKRLKSAVVAFMSAMAFCASSPAATHETETLYLSGHGCDDMVDWDFYCTGGRHSGKWSRIGVPSCWELQGYGIYQYGYEYNKWNKNPSEAPIADEKGIYRHTFKIPSEWKGRRIELVFEASMTDTEVKVNGKSAGEKHQGGFSPFRYDISDLVNYGKKENILEVTVSKESSDPDMNLAERRCDYWNFGGIIRPVYLECRPASSVRRVAVDADMHGRYHADCFLQGVDTGMSLQTVVCDASGKRVAECIVPVSGDSVHVEMDCGNPRLWTAETPVLYNASYSLLDKRGRVLHRDTLRFGFRSVELRKGDGLFINGTRVKMKGVNRHSFRPESGRTLSHAKNLEDAMLIKDLNMNAVRLSHYPADKDFYDICDSVGLYVIDEVTGWQHPQKTEIGKKLVKEMVTRDVNHPSVVIWASGNEGGFNYELEPYFHRYDIQKRMIIYPWSVKDGLNTRHYRSYGEMEKYLAGDDVVMPTEFLHGLYDGGLGAGLNDYWRLMKRSHNSAGGFLWALYDEGVVRTDLGGSVDTKGCWGSDGIVGPHKEKEGSYYTIKEIWCPVQISDVSGNHVTVENCYDFLSLYGCKIKYRYLSLPGDAAGCVKALSEGSVACPSILPGESGIVEIAAAPLDSDALEVTVSDSYGKELFTWAFRVGDGVRTVKGNPADIFIDYSGEEVKVTACGKIYHFSKQTGRLSGVTVGESFIRFSDGPRVIAARRSDRVSNPSVKPERKKALATKDYTVCPDSSVLKSIMRSGNSVCMDYSGDGLKHTEWTFLEDGSVNLAYRYGFRCMADILGIKFDLPEESAKKKRWVGKGPYRVWQNRIHGPQYGYWETDYNDPVPGKTFEYPEFKGYFSEVDWMTIDTMDGSVSIINPPLGSYIGVWQPRDGSDNFLYKLPDSGISILHHIPAVRNKVDYSDLNGPSAQPHWCDGEYFGNIILNFE